MDLVTLHIFFATLGFVFMSGTFLQGLLFFYHERRLKLKRWDPSLTYLPSLLLNEKWALLLLRSGFVFLTVVLITGAMLLGHQRLSVPWGLLHFNLSMISWILYAIVLQKRWLGFGGRKILLLSFLGFVSLTASLLWN